MVQTAPHRHRQPVAWSGMQSTRVSLRQPANDNRRPQRLRPLTLVAGLLVLGVAALFLLA